MKIKPISDSEFMRFADYFYRKTGIRFENSKRYFVDKRISERIKNTNCASFNEYFITLRYDTTGKELQEITNLMTVNETYFFREDYQFRSLVEQMLPEVIAKKQKGQTIRIWSIPSSTGEEAYSIGIYISEYWKDLEHWDVEIISSDIDTIVLEKAKKGIYGDRAVANIPETLREKYFIKLGNDRYLVMKELRDAITFNQVNLVDSGATQDFNKMDIIFCRNLLIYFDNVSRRKAAATLYNALNENGFLCLGHAESMSRISSLFMIRGLSDCIVYQKVTE